jgi:ATP-binding protein involved in chromosome partitioning
MAGHGGGGTVNLDPRPAVIQRRLEQTGRIIAVTGGKGGIGKSMVSCCLALTLASQGRRVGLLDLDLTGPCDHVILGADSQFPEERFGLVPPLHSDIRFMSISHFTGDDPAPLRGADVSNAIIELLTVVQWGELDLLVIDMPPGLGDALLDAARLLRRAEFLVVSTASQVVVRTVMRTLRLLRQLGAPVLGVVENMQRTGTGEVADLAAAAGVAFWGSLPYDEELELALGRPQLMAETRMMTALQSLVGSHLAS